MWKAIKSIYSLLSNQEKKFFLLLILLIFLTSIFEIIGLALILPFLYLVNNLDLVSHNTAINAIYTFFGFQDTLSFLYFIGGSAITFSFLGVILSVYTNIKLTKFSNDVGAQFSIRLLTYYLNNGNKAKNKGKTIRKKILTEPAIIANNIVLPLLMISAKIILIVVLFSVLMIISYQTTLIFLFLLTIVYSILFFLSDKKIKENQKIIEWCKEEKGLLVGKYLVSSKAIDSHQRKEMLKNYTHFSRNLSNAQSYNNVISKLPRYLIMFLIFSSVVLVSSYLATIYHGNMTSIMHRMLLYIVIGLKTLPQLQSIFINYIKLKSSLKSFFNIKNELLQSSKYVR